MPALRLHSIAWNGWRLDIVLSEHAADARLVLLLDGLRFAEQALPAHSRQLQFDFPFAPGGSDELAFSLRLEPQGIELLAAPWCVRHGVAADDALTASTPISKSIAAPDAKSSHELAPLFSANIFSPLHTPDALTTPVTVIVPIYNATALVQRCIESLLSHTQGPARLLLIDDASSDAAIAPLLANYLDTPGITVLRNAQNLGYTRNIALGLSHAPHGDVVVLNADTEVGPNWLLGLRRAAYARADIGTATAVSDNAGAFSVPELEHDNPLPATWSLLETQRALWQDSGLLYPALPTGNGFCMYVKRAMLEQVGGPDVAAFPQGYGEENDWCQRAEQAGFTHVIAGNVLVRHARSASFGDARRESLGRAGMAVLRERYPHYEAAVGATLFSFERYVLDWRVRQIYRSAATTTAPPRPRVLWIVGMQSVSGNETDAARAFAHDFDIWRLASVADGLLLQRLAANGWQTMQCASIAPCIEFAPATWLRYGELFASWLQHYAIELVHVIEASGYSGHVPALAKALALPLLDARETPMVLVDNAAITRRYHAALTQPLCLAQLR